MRDYSFVKMHGLGNDFVFIDAMKEEVELSSDQVARLCDRHMGIGGDGVIVVRPSSRTECAGYMHYINSDGTLAQMCGNGVRCFAKYLIDYGYVDSSEKAFVADTLSGPKPIAFEADQDGLMKAATVDMNAPILEPRSIPVSLDYLSAEIDFQSNRENMSLTSVDSAFAALERTLLREKSASYSFENVPFVKEFPLQSPWGEFEFTCVSMGNPHAVCFIEDWDALPDICFTDSQNKCLEMFNVSLVGAFFEKHEFFPEKANIEFVSVVDKDHLAMRVFERGCGETLACGTGTCATVVAACLTGRTGRVVDVDLLGGRLHIEWAENDHVLMTGPATTSFSGTVTL